MGEQDRASGVGADFDLTAGTQGQLQFERGRQLRDESAGTLQQARQAKFLRLQVDEVRPFKDLGHTEQVSRMRVIRDLAEFLKHGWGMKMPSVIFSVTGGAEKLTLRPKFLDLFCSALLNATRNTNAWVVTGGTNVGIMKLIGDALSRHQSNATTLGVAAWGAIHGRTAMTEGTLQLTGSRTIRIDGVGTGFIELLEKHHIQFTDSITEIFGKFGTVVGVTTLRTPPTDQPRILKREGTVAKRRERQYTLGAHHPASPGRYGSGNDEDVIVEAAVSSGKETEVDKSGWLHWTLVTFHEKSSARAACQKPIKTSVGGTRWVSASTAAGKTRTLVATPLNLDRDDTSLKAVAEKKGFEIHKQRVTKTRGSEAYPYIYRPERDYYREAMRGSFLDPNHSHYLLVDDGTDNDKKGTAWGCEVSLRSELLDFFSYRHDVSEDSLETLTRITRERTAVRTVPVLCLVFGGGPNTLKTILEHIDSFDPVIIVTGSGRCADLIADWASLQAEADELENADAEFGPWKQTQKQNSLARSWLLKCGQAKVPTSKEELQELEEKMENFRNQMDLIIHYQQLRFFDVAGIIASKTVGRLVGRSHPDLQQVVLESIFASSHLKNGAKLPLAIRYESKKWVKDILDRQGLTMLPHAEELTEDWRVVLFSAFKDQMDIFTRLQDYGFDAEANLDNLILLELHQLAQLQLLHTKKEQGALSRFQNRDGGLEPPMAWIKEQRWFPTPEVIRDPHERQDFVNWPMQKQIDRLKELWKLIPYDQQIKIVTEEIERVGWDKLPWVNGWQYKAAVMVGDDPPCPSNQDEQYKLGKIFEQVKVERTGAGVEGETVITLRGIYASDKTEYRGRVIDAPQAQELVAAQVAHESVSDDGWKDPFLLCDCTWVLLDVPNRSYQVLLQQVTFDGVVGSLELNERGRWCAKEKTISARLMHDIKQAFRPWLELDEVNLVDPWWTEKKKSSGDETFHAKPLHPYHRLFWAVATGREGLAEEMWKKLPPSRRLMGMFLASYTLRQLQTRDHTVQEEKAKEWDAKAQEVLDHLHGTKDEGTKFAIFDGYIYFGLDEEKWALAHPDIPTKFDAQTADEREDNAKLRHALCLMGCDKDTPKTRLDLAIIAENRVFMKHHTTSLFLDTVWTGVSTNGNHLQSLMRRRLGIQISPQIKFWTNTLGNFMFWGIFASVFLDTLSEENHRGLGLAIPVQMDSPSWLEGVFWALSAVQVISEFNQMLSFDSPLHYLSGSGNWLDAVFVSIFVLAGLCRVSSLILFARDDWICEWIATPDRTCVVATSIYTFGCLLLALDFMLFSARLLYSFSIHQDIGVLIIVMMKIFKHDVFPFLVLLFFCLAGVEVAGYFFFLVSLAPCIFLCLSRADSRAMHAVYRPTTRSGHTAAAGGR